MYIYIHKHLYKVHVYNVKNNGTNACVPILPIENRTPVAFPDCFSLLSPGFQIPIFKK